MASIRNLRSLLLTLILILFYVNKGLLAKDLGNYGQVWKIEEVDILEEIKEKLLVMESRGEISLLNNKIKDEMSSQILHPQSVKGLRKAIESRVFYYDPSISLDHDLTDHKGEVFYKKDTKVNPLDYVTLSYKLCFIDGDDDDQLKFALNMLEENPLNKIILIKGSVIDLSNEYGKDIYFDQGGVLTTKFKIEQVPAVVSQEEKKLRIEEIKLKSEDKHAFILSY